MLFQEFPNLHIVRHHAVGVEVAEKFIGSISLLYIDLTFYGVLFREFGFRFQVLGVSAAAGKKMAGLIEKETNSSPQSSQRTPRKKIKKNLCDLRVLCGEILIGMASNFMKFHTRFQVSGKVDAIAYP
jgi:hypothetical protein